MFKKDFLIERDYFKTIILTKVKMICMFALGLCIIFAFISITVYFGFGGALFTMWPCGLFSAACFIFCRNCMLDIQYWSQYRKKLKGY